MFIFQFIIFIGFILLLVVLGFVFRIMSAFGGRARYRSFSTHRQEENGSQAHSYTEDAEPKSGARKKSSTSLSVNMSTSKKSKTNKQFLSCFDNQEGHARHAWPSWLSKH